jgi:uncharacterized membrane protein
MILLINLLTGLASVAVAMVIGKLSGLLMFGFPVPFFLPSDLQYLFRK